MSTMIPTISRNRISQVDRLVDSGEYSISAPWPNSVSYSGSTQSNYRLSEFLRIASGGRKTRNGGWLLIAAEQLCAIAELGRGWDSYGGDAPNLATIEGAWTLLNSLHNTGLVPKPHIYPSRSGGVQFEWEERGRYLEIELLTGSEASYFYSDSSSKFETKGQLRENESLDDVVALIDRICR